MTQLRIGLRLGIGFASMVLLIVVMTVFACLQCSKIKEQVDALSRDNFVRMDAAFTALKSVQNVIRNVPLLVISDDPAYKKKVHDLVAEERKSYKVAFAKLEALDKTEKGAALLAKTKESVKIAAAANNKAMDLALAGKGAEAGKVLKEEAEPLFHALLQNFQDVVTYQKDQVDARYREAVASYEGARLWLAVACIVAVLAATAGAVLLTRSITGPVSNMRSLLQDIAQGDLTKRLDDSAKDELGETSRWCNILVSKLREIIGQIADTTAQVAGASVELHATADRIATAAEAVTAQAEAVATAGAEMSATSCEIANSCQAAAGDSETATTAATSGAQVVKETIDVMERIAGRVSNSAKAVESLGSRSDQIGDIVGTIEDIADQTNLLALNAAIEAARAGEQGRGFAVVADEVRALAERTTRATKEIAGMIRSIQQETREAVSVMEEGVSEVAKGSEKASESGGAIARILEQIHSVSSQISQVAIASEEQSAISTEITDNMHQITAAVSQTASGARESASAANQLSHLAEDLRHVVGQFRLS